VCSIVNVSRCDALFRVDDLLLFGWISRFSRLFVFFRGVPSLFLLESVGVVLSRLKPRVDLDLDIRFDDDSLEWLDLVKSVGSDKRVEGSLVKPELPLATRTDCDLAKLSRDLLCLGESAVFGGSSTSKPTEDLSRLTLRDDLALDIRLEGRSACSVSPEITLR
jgi:hypothetical protein